MRTHPDGAGVSTQSLDGRLVCIVDDDDVYRQYLAEFLKKDGYNVVEAADGNQLQHILGDRAVDCIVLDYVLTSENGLALYDELRSRFRRIPPVVMLTCDQNQRTIIKAFSIGISDLVLKRGLLPAELSTAVRNAIVRRLEKNAREAATARVERRAIFDEATGLPSRGSIEAMLTRAAEGTAQTGGHYAIILVALSQFEAIEAKFGYAISDLALRAFASRLRGMMRNVDHCGRYGVDSFMYLIDTDPDCKTVKGICARLVDVLSFELTLDAMSFAVSASVGAAIYPFDGQDPEGVTHAAERALAAVRVQTAVPPCDDGFPDAAGGSVAHDSVLSGRAEPSAAVVGRDIERRGGRRQRTLKRGQIVLKGMHSVIDCTIRDMSQSGARLRVDGYFAAPQEFDLRMVESGTMKPARLRWQNGRELGIQFVSADANHPSPQK